MLLYQFSISVALDVSKSTYNVAHSCCIYRLSTKVVLRCYEFLRKKMH